MDMLSGCTLGYVTQSDLQGDLPTWLVNKCTHIFAPKYIRQLEKAAIGYKNWKWRHNPNYKPWHFAEQISSPKIPLYQVSNANDNYDVSNFLFSKGEMTSDNS